MAFAAEEILDYLSGSDLCLGTVVKDGDGRVQVKGVTEISTKIPHKQVLVSHGVHSGRKAIIEIQNAIVDAIGEIDLAFLWEILSETPGEHTYAEISESYYGDTTPVHISALARKLVDDADHYQRISSNVGSIRVRTVEEAEEMVRQRKMRAEKAAQRERAMDWLKSVLDAKTGDVQPVPEEYERLVESACDYIMCGTNSEVVNLLSRMMDGKSARTNSIRLLKNTGRMPADADEFLLENGIHAGFSKNVLEYADSISADFPYDKRRVVEGEYVFSIDDEETVEIDDAISCHRDGDDYVIGVYIADPACYVSKGDALDEVAEERPLSLYLPTTMVKMFPERLSCDLASLRKGVPRPSLGFSIRMNEEGEILDWSLSSCVVSISERLTYIAADRMIEEGGDEPAVQPLRDLLKVADASRAFRESDGAVVLNRPEIRVRVRNDDVTVSVEDQDTPSHRLVAEFMVLANHLAAKYALRNEIPVIYRVQDPPSGKITSVHNYEPFFFEQQVKHMKRTRLSTYPQPHFGLGLDLYIQISSPLRRYADLVMHRQLAAHCAGREIPYTQEELFVILDNVDRTAGQNRSLEREANKYWLLEYLRRNCLDKEMGATVMKVEGQMILAELDYYCERGIVMSRDKPMPGEHITVTIKEAVPKTGRLVLQMK